MFSPHICVHLTHSGLKSNVISVKRPSLASLDKAALPSFPATLYHITLFYPAYTPQQYLDSLMGGCIMFPATSMSTVISRAYNQCQAHFCLSGSICRSVHWNWLYQDHFSMSEGFSRTSWGWLYQWLCAPSIICIHHPKIAGPVDVLWFFHCAQQAAIRILIAASVCTPRGYFLGKDS